MNLAKQQSVLEERLARKQRETEVEQAFLNRVLAVIPDSLANDDNVLLVAANQQFVYQKGINLDTFKVMVETFPPLLLGIKEGVRGVSRHGKRIHEDGNRDIGYFEVHTSFWGHGDKWPKFYSPTSIRWFSMLDDKPILIHWELPISMVGMEWDACETRSNTGIYKLDFKQGHIMNDWGDRVIEYNDGRWSNRNGGQKAVHLYRCANIHYESLADQVNRLVEAVWGEG